mmetsp:Transcript_10524/g.22895  ORF Transcript_10524/g.22895 Transcript_10524/m.22895 type:complete len:460 (-) Transcript_10524:1041-2420(-)
MVDISALRYMFYGVGPKEIGATKSLDDVPGYVIAAIPCFFFLIGVELIVAFAKGEKLYRQNDTIVSILQGSTQMIVSIWWAFLLMTSYSWVYDRFHVVEFDRSSWGVWLGCLAIVDCGYYWMHRHAHTFHLFWSAHSVHHSGEDYNLATALRQGVFQNLFSWLYLLPGALFFHPLVFAHHKSLNTLYQFWIHTTLVGSLGPLEYVLNTASHHRMHHRPPGNCNYAGVLIIWDRMFGTFVAELEKQDYYGLARQYDTFDPVYANVEHLFRMSKNCGPSQKRDMWFYLGLLVKRRVKHKAVFQPQKLFEPLPTGIASFWGTSAPNRRVRYDGAPSAKCIWVRIYVSLLFAGSIFFALVLLQHHKYTTEAELAIAQLVCLAYFVSIGRLFDGFEKGQLINTCRVVTFLVLALWGPFYGQMNLTTPSRKTLLKVFQTTCLVDAVFWGACTIMMRLKSPTKKVD